MCGSLQDVSYTSARDIEVPCLLSGSVLYEVGSGRGKIADVTSTEVAGAAQDRAWRYSLTSGRFEAADKHSQFATRPIISIRLNKEE